MHDGCVIPVAELPADILKREIGHIADDIHRNLTHLRCFGVLLFGAYFIGVRTVGAGDLVDYFLNSHGCGSAAGEDILYGALRGGEIYAHAVDGGVRLEILDRALELTDVVLYILQADDRAFSDVEYTIKEYVLPNITDPSKLVVGINKVDQLGIGTDEDIYWDEDFNFPSPAQMEYIEKKSYQTAKYIAKATGIRILWFTKKMINKKRIVAYSAAKRYNLGELIRVICDAAGDNSYKIPVKPADPLELMSESAKQALAEAQKMAQNQQ